MTNQLAQPVFMTDMTEMQEQKKNKRKEPTIICVGTILDIDPETCKKINKLCFYLLEEKTN